MLQFCGYCGSEACTLAHEPDGGERLTCSVCGRLTLSPPARQHGPALLVLTLLFAESKVLLLKRGTPPYVGTWAPPGGFVEAGESLERAAVREIEEEVGIRVDQDCLLPLGIQSVPHMNQVYVNFLASLERTLPVRAAPPEALEAHWFSATECAQLDIWPPATGFDLGAIFERVRDGRFGFYQRTDNLIRVISGRSEITCLWRRN